MLVSHLSLRSPAVLVGVLVLIAALFSSGCAKNPVIAAVDIDQVKTDQRLPAAPQVMSPVIVPPPVERHKSLTKNLAQTAELYLDTLNVCNAQHVQSRRWYERVRVALDPTVRARDQPQRQQKSGPKPLFDWLGA